jgi:hypothetical protein
MSGQLDIFKGERQRGTRAPPAREFALHCAVADAIRRWIMPGWKYSHLPMGELRDKITAARLSRMGVTRGWPDMMFFHCQGSVCFLELKRKGSKPTDEQEAMCSFLRAARHQCEVTDDFKKAIEILRNWGVVRAGIEVQ